MLNYIKVSLQEINIFAAVTYSNVYFSAAAFSCRFFHTYIDLC